MAYGDFTFSEVDELETRLMKKYAIDWRSDPTD
jgi:hypothetical protein